MEFGPSICNILKIPNTNLPQQLDHNSPLRIIVPRRNVNNFGRDDTGASDQRSTKQEDEFLTSVDQAEAA